MQNTPIIFDEYFEMGLEESASPFLTPNSRKWAKNLSLRASLFSAFLLVISFALHFYPPLMPLSYVLLIGVYFLVGIPSLIDSIEDILRFEINIDILMTLAAFASVLIGSPFEGALLLVLFAISGAMEEAVETKAKSAVSALYKLTPSTAWVLNEDGRVSPRSVKDIVVGTKVLVKAGEVVPLDGIVVEGVSSVNLVHLTGESLPVKKQVGDTLPAGAANLDGMLMIDVTHTNTDSTLARIIELVTQAQEAKPKIQRWFDNASQRYAEIIILLAITFTLLLPFVIGIPFLGVDGSLYRSLAFLIAASPCALIIAIPIAYLSAVSVCARKGILIKGGMTLDALAKCHILSFDKTGTLTTGNLTCTDFSELTPQSSIPTEVALGVAAALEQNAVHPIARAIENYAKSHEIKLVTLDEFHSVPGYGLQARALLPQGSTPVYLGSPEHIYSRIPQELQAQIKSKITTIAEQGDLLAVMLLGTHLYLFRFEDTIRPGMKEVLSKIKEKREVIMLTGDHANSANKIGEALGIDRVYADLKPEDKLIIVSELSTERGLAMIGDGVNDAPALARATVGIGMGKVGSAAALAAADVVLLQDNLEHLDWLFNKAKKTQAIVRENLILAAGVILLATTPALMGWIPLWAAVILHEGGTLMVGLNALRLLKKG